jgi:hypothetical protein
MDTNALKGHIAEALVENILRRAGYKVSRLGRESQIHRLLKIGADEFLPDFLVWKKVDRSNSERFLHRLLMIEVKYRANLAEYLRSDADAAFSRVQEQWPELFFVFVTDNPDPARSCFQVVDLSDYKSGAPIRTTNLEALSTLDIYPSTVAEYENLVGQIFSLLGGPASDWRRAQTKAPSREQGIANNLPPSEESGAA